MREWWEARGVCGVCKGLVEYDAPHDDCRDKAGYQAWVDTSWQSRANPDNVRWAPGYRFKTEKNSGYRTYDCFYGIDRNGNIEFQGGVRARPEHVAGIQERYENARRAVNWFPGCEDF